MCELLAMSSSHTSHLTFSLKELAAHTERGTRDGWGAAFYQGSDVALFREPQAASDSALVKFLQTQGPSTTLAISHIRHATAGSIELANTQPFAREVMGRMHVFAHNGNLPDIDPSGRLHSNRYTPVGATDSEYAFCSLLDRIHDLWGAGTPPTLAARLADIAAFAHELRQLGPANFLYSDSEVLFAHGDRRIQVDGRTRAPGLFLLARQCADPTIPLKAEGVSVSPGFREAVLIASVPLNDEAWQPLAEGELIAVSRGKQLTSVMATAFDHRERSG